MAEIKTGIFAKNVQKRLNRAQEKSEGSRLQREMKAYMSAIKGMQQASINLTQSLHEVYEPDWHGKDDVMTIGKDCDALWEDFHNKLVDSTLLNLDAYLQQFPDLKTRVAKRSRKLIDFDSARHHVETLQASGMKNDRKIMKAEDELKKAQRVFDELNVGLQDELPTLWDSRVGFYISTYKSVTSLEAKFHREISLVCRQLYEVMTKLAEQHSDKMFTIQGAPSDSGPLRLARTPSPPEDESPPESPDTSSNHMLRPVSPGPPRPKSPTQFKKGPPVPPPPKVTPTKEVVEEQIIDLFGGEFLPAPSPSQPNERPGESLLDMDFDAFQPDESVSPIPQTAIPWDMWSAADAGFTADWSADFGSVPANGDAPTGEEPPGAPAVVLEGAQDGEQGGLRAGPRQMAGSQMEIRLHLIRTGGGTFDSDPFAETLPAERRCGFADTLSSEVSEGLGDGFSVTGVGSKVDADPFANSFPAATSGTEGLALSTTPWQEVSNSSGVAQQHCATTCGTTADVNIPRIHKEPESSDMSEDEAANRRFGNLYQELETEQEEVTNAFNGFSQDSSAPSFFADFDKMNEGNQSAEVPGAPKTQAAVMTEPAEGQDESAPPPAEDKPVAPIVEEEEPAASPAENEAVTIPAEGEVDEHPAPPADEEDSAEGLSGLKEEKPAEKMPIPSVVIEPASSNEGDDDRDADIISPTAIGDNGVTASNQTVKHMSASGGISGLPDDFLYKGMTQYGSGV
ncbi:hypothetical protein INR49_006307 [Caranx melampygus]|nr:hypothetical protein INR49_006307 [Caranx melampygus]